MRKKRKEIWCSLCIWSFICALIGIAVCFIVLFIFSFILYNFTDVIESYTLFSISSLFAGSFICGFICGLFRRNKGLYEGILCGFIMYILLLVIGCICFSSFESVLSLKKFLLCVITSAGGGVIGVNHKRPGKI